MGIADPHRRDHPPQRRGPAVPRPHRPRLPLQHLRSRTAMSESARRRGRADEEIVLQGPERGIADAWGRTPRGCCAERHRPPQAGGAGAARPATKPARPRPGKGSRTQAREPHADGHVPRRASASAGRRRSARCAAGPVVAARPRPLARRDGRRWHSTAIVLLGGGLRLAQASDPGRFISSDERSYARIALNLAAGDGYAAPGSRIRGTGRPGTPGAVRRRAPARPRRRTVTARRSQLRTAFWAQALVGTALILVVVPARGGHRRARSRA